MRNLLFKNREKQVYIDYSLDILFTILLFVQGKSGWAYFFIFITFLDIAFMALVPTLEEKWWYKTITAIVGIFVLVYVVLTIASFLTGSASIPTFNLPS